jgi:hypothetical protein
LLFGGLFKDNLVLEGFIISGVFILLGGGLPNSSLHRCGLSGSCFERVIPLCICFACVVVIVFRCLGFGIPYSFLILVPAPCWLRAGQGLNLTKNLSGFIRRLNKFLSAHFEPFARLTYSLGFSLSAPLTELPRDLSGATWLVKERTP